MIRVKPIEASSMEYGTISQGYGIISHRVMAIRTDSDAFLLSVRCPGLILLLIFIFASMLFNFLQFHAKYHGCNMLLPIMVIG